MQLPDGRSARSAQAKERSGSSVTGSLPSALLHAPWADGAINDDDDDDDDEEEEGGEDDDEAMLFEDDGESALLFRRPR
jgi:hypothetical protein